MYFSLSELPFSIAPDPRFLFMSERHREALSHLTYGLGETGGFVLLTGEVGTGKTTISRCLMEQLPENTQSAFILNPMLSSQELLATLCDQLEIKFDDEAASLKNLTDRLSTKLLENHANGINTLLIIDEAQHLKVEVLEQLRLLTNLETNTKKLLKVILIGQPELQQLLRRRDLRQLAQRITARYHLMPLNQSELVQYIHHRVNIAGSHRVLFNKASIKAIHKLSQGIPRLINLLCHHALMDAFESNLGVVTKKNVLKAAQQALGEDLLEDKKGHHLLVKTLMAASVFVAVLASGVWLISPQHNTTELVQNLLPKDATTSTEDSVDAVLVEASPTENSSTQTLPIANPENSKVVTVEPISASEQLVKERIEKEQLEKKLLQKQLELAEEELSYVKNKYNNETKRNATVIPTPTVQQNIAPTTNLTYENNNQIDEGTTTNFDVDTVEGVSDDLLARFKKAMDETNTTGVESVNTTDSSAQLDVTATSNKQRQTGRDVQYNDSDSRIPALASMPNWVQQGVPPLAFEQHIYATDGAGWVKINGRDRYEGDSIADGVILNEILPQKVILTYQGEKFSLPALRNWQ
jgi:type II secretory pathway predicted ATPase ExeA/nitrate/TMAO reductase-like tetraheme cytochrome c subunit